MKDAIDIKMEIEDIDNEEENESLRDAKITILDWLSGNGMDDFDGVKAPEKRLATEAEAQAVKKSLIEERKNVPEFSLFGDNNWKQIDAQIELVEWYLK